MHITRKQTYSALAGVGILLGAAGIANAATGAATPSADAAEQQTMSIVDPGEADGRVETEGIETDEGVETDDSTENDEGNHDETSYTSSITVADGDDSSSETDEQSQLAALVTITSDDAGRAANAVQTGTVTGVQLENENGNVVFSVIIDTGAGEVDVKVDAGTGTVLAIQADDGADDGADEAGGTEVSDD